MYVTQIRLAKQAWDRGDTNQVLQLLEPYRSDPARQKLCSFAWYYLWRAAHSGGSNTLRGHSDVVRQAVVTPDGSQIITFGDDGQLIVWDAAVGRKLATVALERNVPPRSSGLIVEDQLARRASGLVISSDGAWAAAYGRNLYVGANIRQPDAVRPVTDHQSPIISLAMSPDGKRLASGDYSGEIIVRDAADGRVLRRFHNPRPQALVLSSDGGLVFAGMHDGGLFVWDTNKGNLLGTRAFGDGINSMALSPDGSTLALALAVRDGVVRLWEPGTGRFRGDLRGHHDEVLRVVWSRDGKSLLTASRDQTACLWSNTGGLLRTFRGHLGDVETVAFSPDGQKVVSAGDDQSAILWNVDGGQPCDMLTDTPVDGWVSGLAFTPDGSQVIGTGSCDGAGDSFEAYLTAWNLADANRPRTVADVVAVRRGAGLLARRAADGRGREFAAGIDREVAGEDLELDPIRLRRVLATVPKLVGLGLLGCLFQRRPLAGGGHRRRGRTSAGFGADPGAFDRGLAAEAARPARQGRGRLQRRQPLRDYRQQQQEASGRDPYVEPGDSGVGRADRESERVGGPDDDRAFARRPLPAHRPRRPGQSGGCRQGEDQGLGPRHASNSWASSRPHIRRRLPGWSSRAAACSWPPATWREMSACGTSPRENCWPNRSPRKAGRLSTSPSTNWASGWPSPRTKSVVRVWHIDTGRELADLELALGVPNVVRYTQDGKMLAAATSAGGLFLWDSETYKPRAVLRGEGNPAGQQGHGGVITCVAPLLTDKLLTGSVDKTVRIWDLKTRKAVATAFSFNQAVSCMAVSPDGRTLAVGTGKYRSKFQTGELVLCALDNRQPPKSISQGITPSAWPSRRTATPWPCAASRPRSARRPAR